MHIVPGLSCGPSARCIDGLRADSGTTMSARSPSVKEYLGIRHRWSMRVNFPIGKERESFAYTISDSLVVVDVIEIACHLVTLAKDFDR